MKYLKLFESFDESKIHEICKKYNIENYTINSDGSIDTYAVYLYNKGLKKLPLKFNKIGVFNCSINNLTSLEGSPIEVNNHFQCRHNNLTSFQYSPKIIRGEFSCEYNNIKSFEYFPSFIEDEFLCFNNPIFEVWRLFLDTEKIELLNDFDIFRNEDTDDPGIVMERLNDFLLTIGKEEVERVDKYKNI